jgi:hypothetical protein
LDWQANHNPYHWPVKQLQVTPFYQNLWQLIFFDGFCLVHPHIPYSNTWRAQIFLDQQGGTPAPFKKPQRQSTDNWSHSHTKSQGLQIASYHLIIKDMKTIILNWPDIRTGYMRKPWFWSTLLLNNVHVIV